MKNIKIIFILLLFFSLFNHAVAGDFKVLINYLEGEKSKDSWTKTTTIIIDDKAYTYSTEYSGASKNKNESKNGDFTDDQLLKIKTFILENNLTVTDSLFDESTKYKSFERFTNAKIDIFINNSSNSIKINGDLKELEEKPLYKNSISFIDLVKGFIVGE